MPRRRREKSAFRPCGCDLVELFKDTGWALCIQVDNFPVSVTRDLPQKGPPFFGRAFVEGSSEVFYLPHVLGAAGFGDGQPLPVW
jgi:hypothetical protein